MVSADRESLESQELGGITAKGCGQRRKRRNRQPECASSLRAPRADDPKAGARTKNRSIPTTGSQTSMDPQAWEPREAPARGTDSQRPDRTGSSAPSYRTDLRARIRDTKLRI